MNKLIASIAEDVLNVLNVWNGLNALYVMVALIDSLVVNALSDLMVWAVVSFDVF